MVSINAITRRKTNEDCAIGDILRDMRRKNSAAVRTVVAELPHHQTAYTPFRRKPPQTDITCASLIAAMMLHGDTEKVNENEVLSDVMARFAPEIQEAVDLDPVLKGLPDTPLLARFRMIDTPMIEEVKKRQLVGALLATNHVPLIRDTPVLTGIFKRNQDLLAEHHRTMAAQQAQQRSANAVNSGKHLQAFLAASQKQPATKAVKKERRSEAKPKTAPSAAQRMKMGMGE